MITSNKEREFFVWVNPESFMIQNNLGLVGSFTGGPIIKGIDGPDGLLFIPNPNPKARECSISPFHLGLIKDYQVEFNLEVMRYQEFRELPSRFQALFLLESREEAENYRKAHLEHVQNRILKRAVTFGQYTYSIHDSAWIRFLRLPHSMDEQAIHQCSRGYWNGIRIANCKLSSMGKDWTAPSVMEVLLYGEVNFPNRNLVPD